MEKKLDPILLSPFGYFLFFFSRKSWVDLVSEATVFIGPGSSELRDCGVFYLCVLNINSSAKQSAVFNSVLFFFFF